MGKRKTVSVKVDRELWERFTEWVIEKDGQKYGRMSEHVENSLHEYIDRDRYARIETRLTEIEAHLSERDTTHTHKQTEIVEKGEVIFSKIKNEDMTVVPNDIVHRVIEDVAGGDNRTINKYESFLKKRGLVFEHPSDSEVWTCDQEQWVQWVVDYVNNNPSVSRLDVIDEYPVGYNEIEEKATEVVQ